MKKVILFMAFLIAIAAKAQTTDSTETKLEQYKKWHDSKTISDDEYVTLKAKLLNIENSKTQMLKAGKLPQYEAERISGIVLTSVGLGAVIGGLAYQEQTYRSIVNNIANGGSYTTSSVKSEVSNSRKISAITAGCGAGVAVAGIVLMFVSDKHETLYKSQKVSLNLDTKTNGLGLAMNF
ncbi:MAG TPA: hypothetical protein VGB95_03505 [Chitinophagales bacterium]